MTQVPYLQCSGLSVGLGVEEADKGRTLEQGQGEVSKGSLRRRQVAFNREVESEQAVDAFAMNQEGVEGGEYAQRSIRGLQRVNPFEIRGANPVSDFW